MEAINFCNDVDVVVQAEEHCIALHACASKVHLTCEKTASDGASNNDVTASGKCFGVSILRKFPSDSELLKYSKSLVLIIKWPRAKHTALVRNRQLTTDLFISTLRLGELRFLKRF